MKVLDKIVKTVGGKALAIKNAKATPKVMMWTGVGLIVGSGVYACYKTLKLGEVIDETKEMVDYIHDLKETGEIVIDDETGETAEYTKKNYTRDIMWTYGQCAWKVTKLYFVPFIGATAGVCLVSGGQSILSDRLTQTMLVATQLSDQYSKYRQNVIADQGEDADRKYRLGQETLKNFEHEVKDPETGEVKTIKERKLDVVNLANVASKYAIIADMCDFWVGPKECDIKDLDYSWASDHNTRRIQASMNLMQIEYDAKGYLYLYDVYRDLGALKVLTDEEIVTSHHVGWAKGFGDDRIIYDMLLSHLGSEDSFEKHALIDFNCFGCIDEIVEKGLYKPYR